MSSATVTPPIAGDPARIAADALATARATGALLTGFPAGSVPDDVDAALAIQGARRNRQTGGWKCALPGDGRIILAPIDRAAILDAPGPVRVRGANIRFEPELAFTLARPLDARDGGHDRASVVAAVGEVRLALELVHGRFRDPDATGFLDMLADDLFNEGLVLGPVVTIDDAARLTTIDIADAGGVDTLPANHPAGDPLAPLVWLANYLAAQGRPLQPGITIITGAFTPAQVVRQSGEIRVTFGTLGTLTAAFDFTGARA